ncbi:DUF4381 domain-containing protein [Marinomonas sp. 2405UD68-3]|uniref:DUF4381 domain-containing protein n=1 Tax=Marinomonas sp. 2405UD68-3 TaxID=3391835 RepID=UPI0039C990EA
MDKALNTNIDLPNKAFILPEAIPMWPPAWWTWLVLLFVIIIISILCITLYRDQKKNAYRKEAMQLLKDTDALSDKALLTHCHTVIKRCLVSKNRTFDAAISTQELTSLLDKDMPKNHSFESLGSWFIDGQYQSELHLEQTDRVNLLMTTKRWIKKHHA